MQTNKQTIRWSVAIGETATLITVTKHVRTCCFVTSLNPPCHTAVGGRVPLVAHAALAL